MKEKPDSLDLSQEAEPTKELFGSLSWLTDKPNEQPKDDDPLAKLARALVWRIGKDEDDDRIIVRVGMASALPRFAACSRLRYVSDFELQKAIESNTINIEWIS